MSYRNESKIIGIRGNTHKALHHFKGDLVNIPNSNVSLIEGNIFPISIPPIVAVNNSWRFIKVSFTTNWGHYYVGMTSIFICDSNGVKINNENMMHSAGHNYYSYYIPENCSNTNISDMWETYASDMPNWWKVDLGAIFEISQIRTQCYQTYPDENFKDFTVSGSLDDVTYYTFLTSQTLHNSLEQVFTLPKPTSFIKHVKVNEGWKNITDTYINVGDSWKTVPMVDLNVGDIWK